MRSIWGSRGAQSRGWVAQDLGSNLPYHSPLAARMKGDKAHTAFPTAHGTWSSFYPFLTIDWTNVCSYCRRGGEQLTREFLFWQPEAADTQW